MSTAIASQHNPYIIGRPIHEKAEFFGRDDLFRFIADNLNQQAQVILLHGQRRIGKSSVLAQIPNFVELDDFEFVSLSLEGQANKDLGDLLSELARDIVDQLEHVGSLVKPMKAPAKSAFKKDVSAFSETFLPKVYAALGDKNLVLLLDEFDVLEDHSPESAIEQFFPYLQSILKRHPKLYLVPVVGRRLDELPNLLNLFRRAPYQEVGLLQGKWARDLVTKPAAGMLNYAPEAIDAVIELTAGHPYLTQVLCFAVFVRLREEERRDVTRADVEGAVDKAIELGQAGLTWFRDGLPIAERVMLSAVAAAQSISESTSSPKTPFALLEDHGVVVTDDLVRSLKNLSEWGFVKLNEKTFKIKIRLVYYWLIEKYLIENEMRELENSLEEAQIIYKEVNPKESLEQEKRILGAEINLLNEKRLGGKSYPNNTPVIAIVNSETTIINSDEMQKLQHRLTRINSTIESSSARRKTLCKEVLEVNPNHFSALFELAEVLLNDSSKGRFENSSEVMEVHDRVHRIDSSRFKDSFTKFLLGLGKNRILDADFDSTQEIFEILSSISPGDTKVKDFVQLLKEKCFLDGQIFTFLRKLRQLVELNVQDEKRIRSKIEEQIAKESSINNYRALGKRLIEDGIINYSNVILELQPVQRENNLTSSEVEPIHNEIRRLIKERQEALRQKYQEEVSRFVAEGQISPVARRILARQADILQISSREAKGIEEEVLAPYRNRQEYQQALTEACNDQYPLSEKSRYELEELRKVLRLPLEMTYVIEAASEIQRAVSYFSGGRDITTPENEIAIATQVVMKIESTSSLRDLLIKAMTLGGTAELKELMNSNSLARIVLATARDWI